MALKVDIDASNKKLASEVNKFSQNIIGAYQKIGTFGMAAAAGAVTGIAGMGAAMLFTIGAASKFEDSFAGIKKTVDASDAEFDRLAISIRQLATEIPIATSQLNQIGELGGQLGVETSGLPVFIETIAKLGVATRLSTETAALSLARLQTIFQLPEEEIARLGSTLVELGNNFAALEDEILSTSLRLAAGAKVAGATVQDTLAIATALQAVGVQSQAGGTAMARVFQAITQAVNGGEQQLSAFLRVTGMTREQFILLANTDPAQALNAFLMGLSEFIKNGEPIIDVLEDLNLKQQRTQRAMLAIAEAGPLLGDALNTANVEYIVNNALNEEAAKRFETLKSEMKLTKNAFTELRIEIGNFFLPAAKNILAALGASAEAMSDNEKSMEGMSNSLKGIIAVFTTAGVAIGAMAGQFVAVRAGATMAGMELSAFREAVLTNAKEVDGIATKSMKRYFQSMTKIGKMLPGISAALAVATIAFIVNAAANRKAEAATRKYGESIATIVPLTEQLAAARERLNKLDAMGGGIGADVVSAEIEELEKALSEANLTAVQAMLNIPKFTKDINLDRTKQVTTAFENLASGFEQINNVAENQPDFFIEPKFRDMDSLDFNEQLAEILSLDQDQLGKLLEQDLTAFLNFALGQAMTDDKVLDELEDFFTDYNTVLSEMLFNQDDLGPEQREFIQQQEKFMDDFMLLGGRIGKMKGKELELISEDMKTRLDEYNAIAKETPGLQRATMQELMAGGETAIRVYSVLSGSVSAFQDEQQAVREGAVELANAYNQAFDSIVNFQKLGSEFEPIPLIEIGDIQAGVQRAETLKKVLQAGVFDLIEAGFPALAKSFADGGIEADNMGKLITIMNSGISEGDELLTSMNNSIAQSSEDFATFGSVTIEQQEKLLDELEKQFGVTGMLVDAEEKRALIAEVIAGNVAKQTDSYLGLMKEIIMMSREQEDNAKSIAAIQDEINAMTEDLVFGNVTITQEQIRQVELAEDLQSVYSAISDFGLEGIVTNKEQLTILQQQMNIQRMRDKLEGKMDARAKKSLRDKEKEVKFLEMAVEQGVADQIDLDAAREELEEMTKPLSKIEKEILELQLEIAEAELEILENRKESLSPSVINAIKSYNDKLKETEGFADTVAEKEDELARATEDANIALAENAIRIDKIKKEYPDFAAKTSEIAQLIGLPAQVMQNALSSMEATFSKYKSLVTEINNLGISTEDGTMSFYDQYRMFKEAEAQAGQDGGDNAYSYMGTGFAYGGNIPVGSSAIVGEMGPERIFSTPGGASVFANRGGGSSGVTINNLNVNVTGLPADPITSRKVVMNIQRELTKLESEGTSGTGLRRR